MFPVELPLRCIAAGCKPAGTVLDPFTGTGSTALAARQLDRRFVGVDLNPAYLNLAAARLNLQTGPASGPGGGKDTA